MRSATVIAGILLLVALVVELTNPTASPAPGLGGTLSGVKAKQIDLVVDTAKLFINWSFAVIGANAYFLKASAESKLTLRSAELVLFEVATAGALVSLLFGQLAISNVVGLLELDQFSAASPKVNRYVTLQYWGLIASVIITVASTHILFWRRQHVVST